MTDLWSPRQAAVSGSPPVLPDKLVGTISEQLDIEEAQLKERIGFERWRAGCRLLRNSLTHVFLEQRLDERESESAIRAAINMIHELTMAITDKFTDAAGGMHFAIIKSVAWSKPDH